MELPQEDVELFNKMRGNYVSEKEKRFFEEVEWREQYNQANVDDLLWDSNQKNLSVWFYRFEYSCYMLHVPIKGQPYGIEIELSSLADMLEYDFSKVENANVDAQNVLDYLRKTDYANIDYDRCTDA